ncbi:hypothetical protein [Nonomuraea lactucae]|uniref:hypothetical protein n=1 Tax=Nonomuraea lactucae TaxID=2249762 RepID=UPI0013B3F50B|nr:hypothetical protein [Nonomuraea lactucae]
MRVLSALSVLVLLALALPSVAAAGVRAVAENMADKTLNVAYTCTGGPFTNTSLNVAVAVPDAASGTFDVKWTIPALTLRTAPAAPTQVLVSGALEVTGGTHAELDGTGAAVAAGSTSVPAGQVTSRVTVTAATGGQVTVKPSADPDSLLLGLAGEAEEATSCTTTGTQSVVVTVGQGGAGDSGSDVVEYRCADRAGAAQDVKIRITLTMPASPKAGEQFSIGWSGTYVAGSELKAPAAGLPADAKLYAYASISNLPKLTSATGVGTLGSAAAGQAVTLPGSVTMRTTSRNAGTATVRPAAVNIGATPGGRLVECEVKNPDALKTYSLTIGAGTSTSSATPSSKAARTSTATPARTAEPSRTPRSSITPRDGVATGAGGEAGPDGRVFVLAGSLLILAAGTGGLLLRRRTGGGG